MIRAVSQKERKACQVINASENKDLIFNSRLLANTLTSLNIDRQNELIATMNGRGRLSITDIDTNLERFDHSYLQSWSYNS